MFSGGKPEMIVFARSGRQSIFPALLDSDGPSAEDSKLPTIYRYGEPQSVGVTCDANSGDVERTLLRQPDLAQFYQRHWRQAEGGLLPILVEQSIPTPMLESQPAIVDVYIETPADLEAPALQALLQTTNTIVYVIESFADLNDAEFRVARSLDAIDADLVCAAPLPDLGADPVLCAELLDHALTRVGVSCPSFVWSALNGRFEMIETVGHVPAAVRSLFWTPSEPTTQETSMAAMDQPMDSEPPYSESAQDPGAPRESETQPPADTPPTRRRFRRGFPTNPFQKLRMQAALFADQADVAFSALWSRPVRVLLTALGIAVGVGSAVAIIGLSAASKANVLSAIDSLGANILRVEGSAIAAPGDSALTLESSGRIERIPAVESTTSMMNIDLDVQRNRHQLDGRSRAIGVVAVEPNLLTTNPTELKAGSFLHNGDVELPKIVLGNEAAIRLGIQSIDQRPTVVINDYPFVVIGILDRFAIDPDLDRSVFIGYGVANSLLGVTAEPDLIFTRLDSDFLTETRAILPRTANPASPASVAVSNPSDAIAAKSLIDTSLTRLLLALGGVALVVGGIGVGNVMTMSVLERRTEIGVRRALGARRYQIASQFLVESMTISFLGSLAGAAGGLVIAAGYSLFRSWPIDVPWLGMFIAIVIAIALGGLAGLLPAIRAARFDPAEAIRS